MNSCGFCKHYCQRSYKVNINGAWYRKWAKHRCNLKQEDLYPRQCNFEENAELRKELRQRYPDLAEFEDAIQKSEDVLQNIMAKVV